MGSREHGTEPWGFHRTISIDFTQNEATLPHEPPKSRMTEAPMLQVSYAMFHSRCSTIHSVLNLFCILMQLRCMSVRPSARPSHPLTPRHTSPKLHYSSKAEGWVRKKTSPHPNKNSAFRKSSFWSIARSARDRWKVLVRGGGGGGGGHK